MTNTPFKTLSVTLDPAPELQGLLRIKINRPEIRNAFNEVMIAELTQVFTKEALDPTVKCLSIEGEGSNFCAGGDLNWMKKAVDFDYQQNIDDTRTLTQMFKIMNECPKPLIGLVHGSAIGGGVGLVAVCDIVIATSDTVFSLSEVRLGIVPACIGPFVIAKIGASHARGLFVSAERFNAQKAFQIGLVHQVVDQKQNLQEALFKTASNILQCGPKAMEIAKKLVLDLSFPEHRSQLADPFEYVAQTLAQLRISPEGQEGVRAFLQKRTPSWIKK